MPGDNEKPFPESEDGQALDVFHDKLLAHEATEADVETWFERAVLHDDSKVARLYNRGKFVLGDDILATAKDFQRAFSTHDPEEKQAYQRALEAVINTLLRQNQFAAAWAVAGLLKNSGAGWLASHRYFFLWRMLACVVAGGVALAGNGGLTDTLKKIASTASDHSLLIAMGIALVPIVGFEIVIAPSYGKHRLKETCFRLGTILLNGMVFAGMLGAGQSFVDTRVGWNSRVEFVQLCAATSLALGYVINLIWRDKSVAGN